MRYILNCKHILNSGLQGVEVEIVGEDSQGLKVKPVDKKLYRKYGELNTYVSTEDLREVHMKCGDCINCEKCENNNLLKQFSKNNIAYCEGFLYNKKERD